MRRGRALVFATILVGGIGCARTLPLTDWDRCGLQGMELEGVRMSEVHGSPNWGPHMGPRMMWGSSSATGRAVSCKLPPRDDRDRNCEVKAYEAKATFKMNNKRRSDAALEEVATASVAEWQRVYRNCMAGAG